MKISSPLAHMSSMCCSDDPLPWSSWADGIDKTMQMMANSQKDLVDFDLKLLSGHMKLLSVQTAVHDSANQYQSRLLELEKLRSQQRRTNGSR
jgi:hypothetical protein